MRSEIRILSPEFLPELRALGLFAPLIKCNVTAPATTSPGSVGIPGQRTEMRDTVKEALRSM